MTNEKEIGWDDELPPPEEKKLLPEGDAKFEVLKIERVRKEMGKLGTVNCGVVTLLVTSLVDPDCDETLEENLPLSQKTVFKLYQFFAAIGQYEHGDVENGKPFRPQWNKVVGEMGYCTIGHRSWDGKDGTRRTAAQVAAYLDAQGRSRASDQPRTVEVGGDDLQF